MLSSFWRQCVRGRTINISLKTRMFSPVSVRKSSFPTWSSEVCVSLSCQGLLFQPLTKKPANDMYKWLRRIFTHCKLILVCEQVQMKRLLKITRRSTSSETLKAQVCWCYTVLFRPLAFLMSVLNDAICPQTSTQGVEQPVIWCEASVNFSRARWRASSLAMWTRCWQSMPRTPVWTGSTKMLLSTWWHLWPPKLRHRRWDVCWDQL